MMLKEKAIKFLIRKKSLDSNKISNDRNILYDKHSKMISKSVRDMLEIGQINKLNESDIDNMLLALEFILLDEFELSEKSLFDVLKSKNINNRTLNLYIYFYLVLLIIKEQYYRVKNILENRDYNLKEKYKPIWYALMTLMQDDFPHEIKKMGSELQESVDEVLKKVEEYRVKYAQ